LLAGDAIWSVRGGGGSSGSVDLGGIVVLTSMYPLWPGSGASNGVFSVGGSPTPLGSLLISAPPCESDLTTYARWKCWQARLRVSVPPLTTDPTTTTTTVPRQANSLHRPMGLHCPITHCAWSWQCEVRGREPGGEINVRRTSETSRCAEASVLQRNRYVSQMSSVSRQHQETAGLRRTRSANSLQFQPGINGDQFGTTRHARCRTTCASVNVTRHAPAAKAVMDL
jgi:hypothetical protein